jgi:formylglycine-generating enzyme required for sulfatase activity
MDVMGESENPSHFKECGEACPVEDVVWEDAYSFIRRLNEMTGQTYRLPSEAEWEYAARDGGKEETYAGGEGLDELGWYIGNSNDRPHPVGQKNANGLGLYDMSGNVWEWLEDDWHENYQGAPTDGSAWVDDPRSTIRVNRGGGWHVGDGECRSTARSNYPHYSRGNALGFRLAKSIEP